MESDREQIQREVRFLIEAGATVDVIKDGRSIRATTVNMSGSGVLLHFEKPHQLAVGDQVKGEFRMASLADDSLPCWGLGNVVRVEEDCRVAIMFKGGCFASSEPDPEPEREVANVAHL